MSLSVDQVEVVKSSALALEPVIEQIAVKFYRTMLTENPELGFIFNKSHQLNSAQPRALAMSVVAYAKNIDNLGSLGDLVDRIVQKHCALLVKPEHYPIVGKYLLQAISEHFGPNVANEKFLNAWRVAYQQLASILISAEAGIYEENSQMGWPQYKKFNVIKKVRETNDVTSFYLQPNDGKLIEPLPGQAISFKFTLPNGIIQHRQYSISDTIKNNNYRISVKRLDGGVISTYMHKHVHEGDDLDVIAPGGEFVLHSTKSDVLLLAAGIGITPIVSMAKTAISESRNVYLIQCDRNEKTIVFKKTFERLAAENPNFKYQTYYAEKKKFDIRDLKEVLSHLIKPEVYVVGPPQYMSKVNEWTQNVNIDQDTHFYFDFFGPNYFIK